MEGLEVKLFVVVNEGLEVPKNNEIIFTRKALNMEVYN